jgi:hypothetical protein
MDEFETVIAGRSDEELVDLTLAALFKNASQPDASDFMHLGFALARQLQQRGIDPLPLLEVIHRLTERIAATPAAPASLNGCP